MTSQPLVGARRYGITAFATVECLYQDITSLRKRLTKPDGMPFAPSFLKPSDEQTIVGLAAVRQAINDYGLTETDFTNWSAIAASRFLARREASDVMDRFLEGGAWKATPLFIPHRSLHAVAATVSQALQIKGPNYGVGGGTQFAVEGALSAIAFLDVQPTDGLWLLFTQCQPEPYPDPKTTPINCQAIALGFTPVDDDWNGLRLRLVHPDIPGQPTLTVNDLHDRQAVFPSLWNFLRRDNQHPDTWSCSLNWGGRIELTNQPEMEFVGGRS